jgi:hypothetical protein
MSSTGASTAEPADRIKKAKYRFYFSEQPHDELPPVPTPPQQLPSSQVSGPPVSAARIMAAAQPTPLCTRMASTGQFIWQAPHSMQASLLTTDATDFEDSKPVVFRSPTVKTACGHTSTHIRQPMHLS